MIRSDTDTNQPFRESHPIRIDIGGGPPLRFQSLRCAARTALHLGVPMWDEAHCKGYSVAECRSIVNGTHSWAIIGGEE